MNRLGHLDWLRGIAVLIMIEAHTIDSWTRIADRQTFAYRVAVVLAGYGAPTFMFLAGVALALAAGGRERAGLAADAVIAQMARRGLQVYGLAYLFRLQSWVISGGPVIGLLKVDILNVMGLSMLMTAAFWYIRRPAARRAAWLALAAVAITMLTPLVRQMPLLDTLPIPIASHFRPIPGRTSFCVFPWTGFLFAGAAVGCWLDAARRTGREPLCNRLLLAGGLLLAVGGYAAAYLPSLYARSEFWTSSPTYFFVRLGILIAAIPIARAWTLWWPGWSPIQDFGRASLFVYWVHVELVYGVATLALHKSLGFWTAVAGFVVTSLVMFALAKVKDQVVGWWDRNGGAPLQPAGARAGG